MLRSDEMEHAAMMLRELSFCVPLSVGNAGVIACDRLPSPCLFSQLGCRHVNRLPCL